MLAAVFPGQGSQHVGMGRFLEDFSKVAQETFEEASDTLGYDLRKLCFEGPEDRLILTEFTQPSLLAVSVATFRSLADKGFLRALGGAAGHSVGEYAALVSAGVLPFAKALELVRLRGQLMQQTVPVGEGGMSAVMGLEPAEVDQLCAWAEIASGLGPIEPANYNSPGQIVISGRLTGLKWLQENMNPEKAGLGAGKKVRLIPLKVSAPFHCSMMKKAEVELGYAIREVEFKTPQFAIAQNFTGRIEADPEKIRENLIAQVSGPVRWIDCMAALQERKVQHLLEVGPGKVLSGLAKKNAPEGLNLHNFNSLEDISQFEAALGQA